MIKLKGLRMRVLIMNAQREIVKDMPVKQWDGQYDPRKAVVLQYDNRPSGIVYHSHGLPFTDLNKAWAYSVLIQTKNTPL